MATVTTIATRQELEAFFGSHGWCHDARVMRLEPSRVQPEGSLPHQVTLEIAYQIEGNYRAHTRRVSRVIRLEAKGIRAFDVNGELVSSDHWGSGPEVLDTANDLSLRIDAPALVSLRCRKIVATVLEDLVETVEPWLSERDFSAEVHGQQPPTPAEWLELLRTIGQDAAWHIYRGPFQPADEVPPSGYDGWYLQNPAALGDFKQGVFFFHCAPNDEGFVIHLENQGATPRLWHAMKRVVGEMPCRIIRCGNCEFSRDEWLRVLDAEPSA